MTSTVLDNIKIVHLDGAVTRQEVLAQLADTAVSLGWAKRGLAEAVLAREETYPTGLQTSSLGIAIPHADPIWSVVPSMIVGILGTPVRFEDMGGSGEHIQVSLVFLVAVMSPEGHIDFLRALTSVFKDGGDLEKVRQADDGADVAEILRGVQSRAM